MPFAKLTLLFFALFACALALSREAVAQSGPETTKVEMTARAARAAKAKLKSQAPKPTAKVAKATPKALEKISVKPSGKKSEKKSGKKNHKKTANKKSVKMVAEKTPAKPLTKTPRVPELPEIKIDANQLRSFSAAPKAGRISRGVITDMQDKAEADQSSGAKQMDQNRREREDSRERVEVSQ